MVIDLPGTYFVTIDIPTEFSLLLFGGPGGGRQVINVLERVTVRDSLHANRITGFSLDGPNAVLDGAGSAAFEGDFIFSAGRIAIDVTVGLDGGTLQLDGTGDKVISNGAVLTYIQVARFRDTSTVILQDESTIQWEFSPFTYFDGLTGAFEVIGQMVLKGSGQINLSDAQIGFLATSGLLQGRVYAQESTSINLSNADFTTRSPGAEPPGTVIDLILLSDESVLTGPVVDLSDEYDPAVNPVSGVGLRTTKQ